MQNHLVMASHPLRDCPVCCAPAERAHLFVQERLDPRRLNQFSFASRKEPEFMSHRMVRCASCDLVFVDLPPSQLALADAYHQASYDSAAEAEDAAATYLEAVSPAIAQLDQRRAALEIGTGNGVFLEALAGRGFTELVGVEPSPAAIAAAPPRRRPWIRQGIFREDDFEPASFDLICCFMTMEHVQDPNQVARAAIRLLRPGGAFVTVTHNYRSPVNRALGRWSPIIDIEHMQLFSPQSIRELFTRSGFADVYVSSFVNRYAINYWMRLLPLPRWLKKPLQAGINGSGVGSIKLPINVGNMITWGFSRA